MRDFWGYLGAFLTTVAFLPQVIKIYKDKSAKSISAKTFCIFALGIFCWLVYGIKTDSQPMIWANLITLSLSVVILILKHIYKENN